jgi:hypothetical protein
VLSFPVSGGNSKVIQTYISAVVSGGGCITFGEDWFLVEEVGDGAVVGVGEG